MSAAQTTLGQFHFTNPPPISTSYANPNENAWNAYFGTPTQPGVIHSYDASNRTTWTLPEAYLGQSQFLGNTFQLLALMNNSFITSVMLPVVISNTLQQHWSRWEFPPYLPDIVPELGVVRYVKSNRVQGKSAMVRYGIGMQLQHGFMNTELGQTQYMMHLQQINQSIVEGLQFEALNAIVNVENWEIERARQSDGTSIEAYRNQVEQVIERELFAWGCIQQNANAWLLMDNFIQRRTELVQSKLTHYILDIRVSAFIKTLAHDQVNASIYGPDAQQKIRDGAQYVQTDERGNIIYCTRPFLVDQSPINPMERRAQIGEYVRSFDHATNYENYRTSNRTIKYYSEADDNMVPMTLAQCLDNCYRFDASGQVQNINDLSGPNRSVPSDEELAAQAADFLHRTDATGRVVPLLYFGQMEQKHFTIDDYQHMATTVFNELKRRTNRKRAEYESAIQKLQDCLAICHNVPYDGRYDKWLNALSVANPDTGVNMSINRVPIGDITSVKNNEFGSLNLPTDGHAFSYILPPTHGNYGGFKTIQRMHREDTWVDTGFNQQYGEIIANAMEVFDDLATNLNYMFPDSIALAPRWASSNFHNPSPAATLFENLIARGYPSRSIFLHPTIDGVDVNDLRDRTDGRSLRVEEPDFRTLGRTRKFLMDVFLGNMVPNEAYARAESSAPFESSSSLLGGGSSSTSSRIESSYSTSSAARIMERIGTHEARGSRNVWSYSTQQTPNPALEITVDGRKVSQYASKRWRGALPNGTIDFDIEATVDSSTTADDIASLGSVRRHLLALGALNLDEFDALVFDTLARWTLAPSLDPVRNMSDAQYKQHVNYYSSLSLITSAFSMVNWDVANQRDAWDNLAAIIDTVQQVTGVRFHQNQDPSNLRRPNTQNTYTQLQAVLQTETMFGQLKAALLQLYRNNNTVFSSKLTYKVLESVINDIEKTKQSLISKSTATSKINLSTRPGSDPIMGKFDRDLSTYRPAPITMGRNAVRTFVSDLDRNPSGTEPRIRMAMPASYSNPNVPITRSEILTIQQMATDRSGERKMYFETIGPIFADNYDTDIGALSIDELPLVRNAITRGMNSDDIRAAEEARRAQLRRETAAKRSAATGVVPSFLSDSNEDDLWQSQSQKRRKQVSAIRQSEEDSNERALSIPFVDDRLTSTAVGSLNNEEITQGMRNLFARLCRATGGVGATQVVALAFFWTPITKQAMMATINFNLLHPFDYLCCRPHATYTTVCAVKIRPGVETGRMNLGNIIAEVGDDAAIGLHTVGITFYQGPSIYTPKNIFVLNDVMVTKYIRGLGTGFINPDHYRPELGIFGADNNESFIIMAVPRHEIMKERAFCMSGRLTWVDRLGRADLTNRFGKKYSYSSAAFYNAKWGFRKTVWNNDRLKPILENKKYFNHMVTPNDMCFKSTALYQDPTSLQWTLGSVQLGHWKLNTVGQGKHRARVGEASFDNSPSGVIMTQTVNV